MYRKLNPAQNPLYQIGNICVRRKSVMFEDNYILTIFTWIFLGQTYFMIFCLVDFKLKTFYWSFNILYFFLLCVTRSGTFYLSCIANAKLITDRL